MYHHIRFNNISVVCLFVLSRVVEEAQSSPVAVEEISVSFFSLLQNILRAEVLSTTSTVRSLTSPVTKLLSLHPRGSFT